MKEDVIKKEYERSIVNGGTDNLLHCTVCNLDLQSLEQAEAHVKGKKHGRRRRYQSAGLIEPLFEQECRLYSLLRIVVVGDCHGGRSINLMSPLVASFFYGGTIYSWIKGKRSLPPLVDFIGGIKPTSLSTNLHHQPETLNGSVDTKDKQEGNILPCVKNGDNENIVVVVFSYGEIDVRMHAAKWFYSENTDNGVIDENNTVNAPMKKEDETMDAPLTPLKLARSYVQKVIHEVKEMNVPLKIVPIILAIPPPSNARDNPQAPFVGSLQFRVEATLALNNAIAKACLESNYASSLSSSSSSSTPVYFTGVDTWNFATIGLSESSSSPFCISEKERDLTSNDGYKAAGREGNIGESRMKRKASSPNWEHCSQECNNIELLEVVENEPIRKRTKTSPTSQQSESLTGAHSLENGALLPNMLGNSSVNKLMRNCECSNETSKLNGEMGKQIKQPPPPPPPATTTAAIATTTATTCKEEEEVVGALLMSVADGHVHVQSNQCGKVHERLRQIIRDNIFA